MDFNIEHDFTTLPLSSSILDKYPGLKEVFGAIPGINEPTIRYVIAYYNKRSPIRDIGDLVERKRAAAKLAGFFLVGDNYPEEVEDIFFGRNEEVNELIIAYAHSQGSSEFVMLAGYEQALYDLTLSMLKGEFDKYTIKMTSDLQIEIDRIKDLLLAKDRFVKLEKTLYKNTSKIKIDRLRPEIIAEKLRDGLPPVDVTPYGNYNFERHGSKNRIPDLRYADKG